jgi:hypothetical protein
MIELKHESLFFTFPEIHPEAQLEINFLRTLRVPDDGKTYPLPPGLGNFPLRHVDDFVGAVPKKWIEHGGVMFPMYQSEALWINFSSRYLERHGTGYPYAVKVATGKINAVTGDRWDNRLNSKPQDYMVAPEQPWLDGYCVEKGLIRQFVAMPLGSGYSVEEQITGDAEHGGLQIIVYPMKRSAFEKRYPEGEFSLDETKMLRSFICDTTVGAAPDIGLAPGGKMKQEIYEDPFDFADWDQNTTSRCFIHLANSMVWRSITGEHPPTVPFTVKEYTDAGLPWFDYYNDDASPIEGSKKLKKVKSVSELGKKKGEKPLPEKESVNAENIINLRKNLTRDQVREGNF